MPRSETGRFAPRSERERRPTSVIVYAGTNSKRLSFLKYAFTSPRFIVDHRSGGKEHPIDDVVQIARGKVGFVWHRNPDIRALFAAGHGNLILGTDLRTNPLQRYSLDTVSKTHSKARPSDEGSVRKTFGRIARAAQNSDSPPFYRADSGTVLARREAEMVIRDNLAVVLDPEKMEYFRTPRGFDGYKETFGDYYYSSQIYGDDREQIPALTDIAGGLSLGVLLVQDAVLEIGGVKKGDEGWRQAVKNGLYHVLISFSPQALRSIRPDIDQVINDYPALESATALALGELPLKSRQVQESVIVPVRRSRRTT